MKRPKFIPEFRDIPSERQKMPELPLEERKLNFREVELGFSEEMVLKEAARCLSCRRCIGCGLCLAECDSQAIVYDETASTVEIEADAIVFTSDGQVFNPDRKPELGYSDSANVITSLEFERLVSPTGPFGGLLVRPFDGDIAKRIAFIQCVGSREEGIGANFCSADCCSRTFSQARRVRELVGDADIRVFHRGLRPVGKRSELDLAELKGEKWIEFIAADVTSVSEDPEDGTVTVNYSKNGETTEARFDLVVLAVGVQALKSFRQYSRAGGIKVNKFGFVERNIGSLVAEGAGVSFGGTVCGPAPTYRGVIDALAGATRSLDASAASARESDAGPGPARSSGGDKTFVYVCEYGLELAGRNRSAVEGLKADGFEMGGLYPFLCHKDGREAMMANEGETSSIVVVGCHKRSHEQLFEQVCGLPRGRVTIVGREEIEGDLSQNLTSAVEGLSANAVKQESTSEKKPTSVVVVGGGTSGLAAASELLRRGVHVIVVEKSAQVGKSLTLAAIVEGAEVESVEEFVKAVEANPNATILKSSTVISTDRSDGKLNIKVCTPQGEETMEVGAILLATGASAYDTDEYVVGSSQSVITQSEFRARITEGQAAWKRLAILQCVGVRSAEHPYCSRFCCKQALANVLRFKEDNPEAEITIFHKGIRVFGFEEELYTDAADKGVNFVEIEDMAEIAADDGLKVKARSKEGKDVAVECDAVVLSVGHVHGADQHELSRTTGVALDDLSFFVSGDSLAEPFTTPVDGIFTCGFARGPVIAEEAFIEGVSAAGEICRYLRV